MASRLIIARIAHYIGRIIKMKGRKAMDVDEDIAPTAYKWEQGIQASWDAVKEDEEGRILAPSDKERSYRAKRHQFTQSIRRGLIRFLVLALDCADSAQERDFRPTRLEVCRQSCRQFITQFFDQNPISQLALAVTKDRIAEKVSDLSGNSKLHIHQLSEINKTKGLPSLQNTIHLALTTLQHIPNYGHRELLILYNSLSSCDPSNIFDTLEVACQLKLRISIISLTAEVYICKHICEVTGGRFNVAMDSSHLLELLQQHTIPPPELQSLVPLCTDFVYMGFPKRQVEGVALPVYEGRRVGFSRGGYVCPRCTTRCTDLPTQCVVCGLQLNSSAHIARSYHHLFPVQPYSEYRATRLENGLVRARPIDGDKSAGEELLLSGQDTRCKGCLASLLGAKELAITTNGERKTDGEDGALFLRCPLCSCSFCLDCDLYIHEGLHNCPGCV